MVQVVIHTSIHTSGMIHTMSDPQVNEQVLVQSCNISTLNNPHLDCIHQARGLKDDLAGLREEEEWESVRMIDQVCEEVSE